MVKDIKDIHECPDCASSNIYRNEEREQIICRECGLIYEPLTPMQELRFEVAHEKPLGKITARPRKTKKKVKKKKVKAKKAVKKKPKKKAKKTKRRRR